MVSKSKNTYYVFVSSGEDMVYTRISFDGEIPEELNDLTLKGQKGNILVYGRE